MLSMRCAAPPGFVSHLGSARAIFPVLVQKGRVEVCARGAPSANSRLKLCRTSLRRHLSFELVHLTKPTSQKSAPGTRYNHAWRVPKPSFF